ncbi:hypothetical protein AAFF_G00195250 [Aldrovandia affinis]|uniref:Uncharacterized protein n=1 Tax=Aldrovandia affinis TaxID=143900 RepID=A0AAD7WV35_9TELE|nr:hypothetical protein AAFF_G00195250 [Aldrovandia affinis]
MLPPTAQKGVKRANSGEDWKCEFRAKVLKEAGFKLDILATDGQVSNVNTSDSSHQAAIIETFPVVEVEIDGVEMRYQQLAAVTRIDLLESPCKSRGGGSGVQLVSSGVHPLLRIDEALTSLKNAQ